MPANRAAPTLLTTMIALLILTLTAMAAPVYSDKSYGYPSPPTDLSKLNLTPPLSNGSTSLPPPSGTLKAITLGFGTQNYTCNATTPTPVPVGAKAVLFDLSPYLPWIAPFLSQIPARALTINFDNVAAQLVEAGQHIFTGSGTPDFDLGEVGEFLGKKAADIVAPEGSPQGENGLGSVNWLKLSDAGGSQGITEAYRVDTAGGKPPKTCDGQEGILTSPYATLYWFYG